MIEGCVGVRIRGCITTMPPGRTWRGVFGWNAAGRKYEKEVTDLGCKRYIGLLWFLLFMGVMFGGIVTSYAGDITVDDVQVTEGSGDTVKLSFTVLLDPADPLDVTVDYAFTPDTALEGTDYTNPGPGTLTFTAGETSKVVEVSVTGDLLDEEDETVFMDLSNPVNAVIADNQAVGTIVDNDPFPYVSIFDATVTETDAGAVDAVFTVSLSAPSTKEVTVDFGTFPLSAKTPEDYTDIAPATLIFAPGETVHTLTVDVIGDIFDEDNETFSVNLSNPVNTVILDAQGLGAIVDDDDPPEMSIFDADVTEGDTGFVNAVFTVTLTEASGKTVTVDYATENDSAAGGTDYLIIGTTTLTFAPGETVATIDVPVRGDAVDEDNETFNVNLQNAHGAVLVDDQAVGIIRDNDTFPQVSIADVTVVEGDTGSINANLTVSLSWASGKIVTVDYTVTEGTAAPGIDYTTPPPGTLIFEPGETEKIVSVPIMGDVVDEVPETFEVNLSNAAFGVISDDLGVGTINDDDATPAISIHDAAVTEGNVGTVDAVFTVSLSRASGMPVTVDYATTVVSATPGTDYTAIGTTTLTFNPGETLKIVTVSIISDTLDEDTETFGVSLTNPANATISDNMGVGAINDDDEAPYFSISDVGVIEGDSGPVDAIFTVTLSLASGKVVTVDYSVEGDTAVPEKDIAVVGNTTLTFGAGETTKTIRVPVLADTLDEDTEVFFVNLTNNSYGQIADGRGQGTVTDNDPAPTLSIDDVEVTEGNGGTTNAVFTVTLSAVSEKVVTVDYVTVADTASSGSDYAHAVPTTLTFDPGEIEQTLAVAVVGDEVDEEDERFTVELFNAQNGTMAGGRAVAEALIIDDEAPEIVVKGNNVTVVDGDGSPSDLDHTDFGEADIKNDVITRVFSITNMGTAELLFTGDPHVVLEGAGADAFTVTQMPPDTLERGGVTSFEVTFDPEDLGQITAFVSISTNDPLSSSHDFTIRGTGVPAPAIVSEDNQRVRAGENLTSNGSFTGVVVDEGGTVVNSGTLTDLTNNGTVTGGTLSGFVINTGSLSNVTLVSGTVVDGGNVSGTVSGSGEIRNALVAATTLGNVTLGRGVVLTEVTAENNPGLDLGALVTNLQGEKDPDMEFFQNGTGDRQTLSDLIARGVDDFMGNSDTEVEPLANENIAIINEDFGELKVLSTLRSVVTSDGTDALEMTQAGELLIVRSGIAVTLVPAPVDRSSFLGGLLGIGILGTIDPYGVVTFKAPGGERFALRFDFTARLDPAQSRVGEGAQTATFVAEGSPAFRETYRLKAIYPDGTLQFLPPYIHAPGSFREIADSRGLNYRIDSFTGIILLFDENNNLSWRGIPDYILYDPPAGTTGSELTAVGDLNGDGRVDFGLITTSGAQPIYTLP